MGARTYSVFMFLSINSIKTWQPGPCCCRHQSTSPTYVYTCTSSNGKGLSHAVSPPLANNPLSHRHLADLTGMKLSILYRVFTLFARHLCIFLTRFGITVYAVTLYVRIFRDDVDEQLGKYIMQRLAASL